MARNIPRIETSEGQNQKVPPIFTNTEQKLRKIKNSDEGIHRS